VEEDWNSFKNGSEISVEVTKCSSFLYIYFVALKVRSVYLIINI
jgi:hypothetical protein